MHHLTVLKVLMEGRIVGARRKARRNQIGASAVEWVVITALLIGIAVAVGAIILTKLQAKAQSLNP
jgi:Flp pilus assembly protein TadG